MAVLNPNQLAVQRALRFAPSGAALPSAALLAGAAAGALAAGRAGDALGPATSLAALVAPAFALGSLLAASAASLGWLCLARALAGGGAGAASTLVPRYLADASPPARRGALGAAHQVLVCVGIVAAMLAGLPYEGQGSGKGGAAAAGAAAPAVAVRVRLFGRDVEPWRAALAAGALPALLLALVASVLAPESPSWLAFVGRSDDAAVSLRKLRGGAGAGVGGAAGGDEEGGRGAALWSPSTPPPSSSPAATAGAVDSAAAGTDSVSPLSTTALAGGGASKPLLRTTSGGGTPLTPRRARGPAVEDFASSLEAYHNGGGGSGAGGAAADGDGRHRRTPPPASSSNAPSLSPQALLSSAHGHPMPLPSSSCAASALSAAGAAAAAGGAGGAAALGGGAGAGGASRAPAPSPLRAHRRAVSLALGLALAQQASGINTVVLYSTSVLSAAGSARPVLAGAGVAALNAAASAAAACAADGVGRRPLLLGSYAGMALALALLSASPHLSGAAPFSPSAAAASNHALGPAVAVAALLLYVAAFAGGAGPITWLYMAEVLPEEAQGGAGALAAAANWAANLLVGSTFPALLAGAGVTGAYGLYAVLNVGCFLFVRRRVVETARRPLAEARAAVANG